MNFERLVCSKDRNAKMPLFKCDVKYISRRHLRFDIQAKFSKPLRSAYLHFVFYYKYNTHQKFAIDLCDDMCGRLDGKKKSFFWIQHWIKGEITRTSITRAQAMENIYVKIINISIDNFLVE